MEGCVLLAQEKTVKKEQRGVVALQQRGRESLR